MMEKKREVVRFLSVFNLNTNKIPHLPEDMSARIMFVYDKLKNIREYKILDSGMTEEMGQRIRSWLDENIEADDVIHGLN
jgi:hypothetical protein